MAKRTPLLTFPKSLQTLGSVLSVSAGLSLHLAAYLQFLYSQERLLLPASWYGQFLFALLLSLALSLATPFFRRNLTIFLVLFIRCWITVFLGLPFSESVLIELSLLFTILLDANIHLQYPADLVISIFTIFVGFLSQTPVSVWNNPAPAINYSNHFTLVLFTLIFFLMIFFMKRRIHTLSFQKEQSDRAREASLDLANINVELQRHSIDAENFARYEERKHISQELHDTVGYALTNQLMMMEAAIRLCGREHDDLWLLIEQARGQARESLQEMKATMSKLRSTQKIGHHGIEGLKKLEKAFARTSLKVIVDYRNVGGTIREDIDETIYRIVQEAITNAIQHGFASTIQVSLWRGDEEISVTITDDGIGCAEIKEGVGLRGMRERLAKMGGSLRLENVPNGFFLDARMPYREVKHYEENTAFDR